jgi:tRNA pseudouridine55 synthase
VDLARSIGTGGHVEVLRRIGVSDCRIEEAITLDQLEALTSEERMHRLKPMDALVSHFPHIHLDDAAMRFARCGNPFDCSDAPKSGWVRIYGPEGFLGLGEILEPGRVSPRRMANLATL